MKERRKVKNENEIMTVVNVNDLTKELNAEESDWDEADKMSRKLINQSINQSISRSIDRWIDRSIDLIVWCMDINEN